MVKLQSRGGAQALIFPQGIAQLVRRQDQQLISYTQVFILLWVCAQYRHLTLIMRLSQVNLPPTKGGFISRGCNRP